MNDRCRLSEVETVSEIETDWKEPFNHAQGIAIIELGKYKNMTLTDQINNDLKAAMKAKDKQTMTALRAIKSQLLLAATEKGAGETSDEAGIKMLQKLVKQRKESAELYQSQGREDLAAPEMAEAAIIEKYLPKQLSAEELKPILQAIIDRVGAKEPKDMGKVMGVASKELGGKADGKTISTVVKELLS